MSKKGVLRFSISCLVPEIFKFLTYYKSSIKRPTPCTNKRLPSIKRPPFEPFCTKRPSLISAPLISAPGA